jgi:thioredoxin-related protein
MKSLLLLLATLLTSVQVRPAAVPETTHGKIPWFSGTFEDALARAKTENKVVFVDLWTSTCVWCKKLDKDTYSDDSVVSALKDVICVSVDAEGATGAPLARRFGATLFPTMVVLDADGTFRDKLSGYLTPTQFKLELARCLAKPSLAQLRAQVEADKTGVDKRWQLAQRLLEAGIPQDAELEIAAIKKLDPEGKSLAMHFIALQDVMKRIEALWQQRKAAETPPLLKEFLAHETYPEVQFRAWNVLGQIYGALLGQATTPAEAQRLNLEARNAQMTAWRTAPDAEASAFGKQILRELYANKDKLSDEDKAFALDVAARVEHLGANDPDAFDLAAGAHFMNGKKEDAQRLARRAVELDPKNADYALRLKEFGG